MGTTGVIRIRITSGRRKEGLTYRRESTKVMFVTTLVPPRRDERRDNPNAKRGDGSMSAEANKAAARRIVE